ncbi:DNA polymerase delta subunit 3 [Melitaea cinxia]|uniref:DNA polymerase delta subunit 3 n=1 Tax=Melitaea cinxia TaxID=113334 RepID=UPI001E273FFF|nr:DNA polymerase delta subunit 3 [Melitaea cinxia]
MESEESFKTSLNTVKEMLLDEEKIVTYVSLSKDLCIHINTGKKLLHVIVKQIAEQCPDVKLNVNYIISGITDENKARTTVCTGEELKNLKTTFKTILYEHVYSVSIGSPKTDHAAYLLLNKFDDYHLCAGSIKNIECNKHTFDEIGSLKSNSQQATTIESKDSVIPQKKIKSESKNITTEVKNKLLEEYTNGEVNDKLKTNIKTESVSPRKETSNKKPSNNKSNSHNNKTQKGIVGFFNKSNTNQKKTLKEPENKREINVLKESKSIEIKEEKMEIDSEIPSQEPEEEVKNESKKNNNKVLNQIKKTSKVDKKRKRVLKVSDSDSDEENDPFADKSEKQEVINESDDEIPPTPSVNSIKITSGIVNPKKRRKIVDKTYTDEDGYILTKKEEVYESCSENEEDVKVKEIVKERKSEKQEITPKEKKSTASTKKKISPPQKGKQPTLAHFFTKK